jgi:Cd2+/Zn2+-exporting ATPase
VICADGILTEGKLRVTAAYSELYDEETFLCVAAHAMAYASDPAAEAILEVYSGDIVFERIRDFREIPNCGVMIDYEGTPVVLGTQALMASVKGLLPKKMSADRQMMFMLVGNEYAGYFVLTDPISELSDSILNQMEDFGVGDVRFITSYSDETAEKIAERSGIKQFVSGLSCDERTQYLEKLCDDENETYAYFCVKKFADDVHSAADYDVCIGGDTKDLLDGKTEVVSITHRPEAVIEALGYAHSVVRMCHASVNAMLAVKLLLVMLAGAGMITVWFAAAFEMIATLFVKVYSASAFDEKTLERFIKKPNVKRKEKAE